MPDTCVVHWSCRLLGGPRGAGVFALLAVCGLALADAPDLSTPRAAANSFYTALRDADAPALMKILHSPSPAQRDAATALTQLAAAQRELRQASEKHFTAALEMPLAIPDSAQIGVAPLEQDEDQATLKAMGVLKLRRIGESWRVPLSDYAGVDDARLPHLSAYLRAAAEVSRQVAAQISAGEFASADEAARLLQSRLADATVGIFTLHTPTTAPAR